jgi:steroid 5-alpha reductase family enzyme
VADAQLRDYGRKHHGGVADQGVWAWSRHPNYFFEWLGWWAYVAIAVTPSYWQGWLALIGPAMMYWLLVHASGIPHLEAHMECSRGEAWRAYKKRTSPFFPLPPRT